MQTPCGCKIQLIPLEDELVRWLNGYLLICPQVQTKNRGPWYDMFDSHISNISTMNATISRSPNYPPWTVVNPHCWTKTLQFSKVSLCWCHSCYIGELLKICSSSRGWVFFFCLGAIGAICCSCLPALCAYKCTAACGLAPKWAGSEGSGQVWLRQHEH